MGHNCLILMLVAHAERKSMGHNCLFLMLVAHAER
jgi:hypothetical protein